MAWVRVRKVQVTKCQYFPSRKTLWLDASCSTKSSAQKWGFIFPTWFQPAARAKEGTSTMTTGDLWVECSDGSAVSCNCWTAWRVTEVCGEGRGEAKTIQQVDSRRFPRMGVPPNHPRLDPVSIEPPWFWDSPMLGNHEIVRERYIYNDIIIYIQYMYI